ncbi:hypothetical protein PMG71_23395 [Roseofilum sp. BLCC_M154]|uniref:Tetratricopeptide repeat protein n=1 Tax=Roseofilum acuticapitatum BLCC-M154 TaxID=3022444 RepID=A0ABT7AZN0_9CYAN|nr:hypothetical protein [Roseofilum acuticapitatum]MDJ1172379.1 hypothetical protein [Roseofilum acuticapitatum BLCC-M154]
MKCCGKGADFSFEESKKNRDPEALTLYSIAQAQPQQGDLELARTLE